MLKKHRVLLALLVTAWLCGTSIAQESTKSISPMTKSGSLAFEFDFGGLDNLSMPGVLLATFINFDQGTNSAIPLYAAGVKYYLSDGLALRAMLGFSNFSRGADTLSTGSTKATFYGIAAGIEMHTHAVYAVSPYFGGQVSFESGSSTNSKATTAVEGRKSDPLIVNATTVDTKKSATGFGVGVMAGFDWYVFEAVAIGCEYDLSFGTTSSTTTVGSTTTNQPASSGFGIGSANIHLLIHL